MFTCFAPSKLLFQQSKIHCRASRIQTTDNLSQFQITKPISNWLRTIKIDNYNRLKFSYSQTNLNTASHPKKRPLQSSIHPQIITQAFKLIPPPKISFTNHLKYLCALKIIASKCIIRRPLSEVNSIVDLQAIESFVCYDSKDLYD